MYFVVLGSYPEVELLVLRGGDGALFWVFEASNYWVPGKGSLLRGTLEVCALWCLWLLWECFGQFLLLPLQNSTFFRLLFCKNCVLSYITAEFLLATTCVRFFISFSCGGSWCTLLLLLLHTYAAQIQTQTAQSIARFFFANAILPTSNGVSGLCGYKTDDDGTTTSG